MRHNLDAELARIATKAARNHLAEMALDSLDYSDQFLPSQDPVYNLFVEAIRDYKIKLDIYEQSKDGA